MQDKITAMIFFFTSAIGALGAAEETHIGMVASFVLFAGSVLAFFSTTIWSVWMPFVGSALLAACFIPAEIRNILLYPHMIFSDSTTTTLHATLVGFVVLSVVLSTGRLVKFHHRPRLDSRI
jgi:hypothetical protein